MAKNSDKTVDKATVKKTGRPAYRTELSINDIRRMAWNVTEGDNEAYEYLKAQNKMLAKMANSRMRALKTAGLDMFAYDRAVTYLSNNDMQRFPTTLPKDFQGIVVQMSELISFINSKTSTIAGAKDALDKKMEALADATGKTFTEKQKYNLGRLMGLDSISTLLRDIRGDSAEVIEVLEEISLKDIQKDTKNDLVGVVDNYLGGWQPFDIAAWGDKSRGMNYDELMRELRRVRDEM